MSLQNQFIPILLVGSSSCDFRCSFSLRFTRFSQSCSAKKNFLFHWLPKNLALERAREHHARCMGATLHWLNLSSFAMYVQCEMTRRYATQNTQRQQSWCHFYDFISFKVCDRMSCEDCLNLQISPQILIKTSLKIFSLQALVKFQKNSPSFIKPVFLEWEHLGGILQNLEFR